MDREYIDYICEKIELDEETCIAVNNMLDEKFNVVESLAGQLFSAQKMTLLLKELKHYDDKGGLFALCVVLAMTQKTYEAYDKAGIDEKIFFDTMSDIRIWAENYRQQTGKIGIDELSWIEHHLHLELFRIGRLQFQFFRAVAPAYLGFFKRRKFPIKPMEKTLFVHIPQGEPLLYDDCIESFKAANEFFAKYHPRYNYKWFVSESWLLYPENRNFMDANSNIYRFMSLFDIKASMPLPFQAIERIWGKREKDIDDYLEDTTLRANAKNYIKNQGRLGIGYGIIEADKYRDTQNV